MLTLHDFAIRRNSEYKKKCSLSKDEEQKGSIVCVFVRIVFKKMGIFDYCFA